jgi:hypothetical protein
MLTKCREPDIQFSIVDPSTMKVFQNLKTGSFIDTSKRPQSSMN